MSSYMEIQIIAVVIAVACSIPGCLLVIKQMAMLADSISHTILLGIVVGYFITKDLNSPLLIIGAGLMGLCTVWLTETVERTRKVSSDAAVGLVYPLLFSIAIILISKYGSNVHLDTDSVMLGELAFAPFNRLKIMGWDMGPKSLYTCGTILVLNILMLSLFYKEIKLASFDPMLAKILGFSPVLVHYTIMAMVSVTAVGAFEAIGSILVVALMIGPANGAYLLANSLKEMILLSAIIGAVSSVIGVHVAFVYDLSIAGCISVVIGIIFALIFLVKQANCQVGRIIRQIQ